MFSWLKSLFQPPEPAGPTQSLKKFCPPDKPITQDGVTVADNGWCIESQGKRTVRLFEVPGPGVEQCMLTYRTQMKTANVRGGVYLEMWCRFPWRGEFFSKGFHHKVNGTTEWASYETPFYLKEGQRPDLIKLNIVFEGGGTVWIRDVELLQTPLK